MSDTNTPQSDEPAQEVIDQPMGDILASKYLSYALSTIMSRSLPDVRDGLKPVHRRLLYAMNQLRLNPDVLPKKSARVVGDVIGKYHPHGDSAVYDTMVRLAQDFAVRYPLVDGQGNFGNIDGDNPAAMRYTEARMTETAIRLLEGIDENAVDFEQTYDGEGEEPVVLPANFPNLLANGAAGIAVGMATNIPPHNVTELCDAMLMMLDRDVETDELMQVVKGPDLPTGGIIVEERNKIRQPNATGRGGFRIRARWEREDLKQGQYQLVVTEIPYQVQKAKLVEKIAELVTQRKLPMLDDIRDESAEDIRLVLVPKSRNVEPELLMEALFRHSDLETKVSLNMNVLDQGRVPRVMSLKQVLQSFLAHRQDVLVRRSQHRLDNVRHRLEILEGYLAVYLNIDEVIRIIRDNDEPRPLLCEAFDLSDIQADAVLNMRLRSLRKLEEQKIREEHKKLEKERDELEALLASETEQWRAISDQIKEMRKAYAPDTTLGARRTQMGQAPSPVDVDQLQEVMTEKEPITVVISQKGWIRAMKGHGHKLDEMKFKEGDQGRFALEAYTTDKIMFIATNGRVYTLAADKLPSGRGFGEPLRLHIDLPNEADIIDMRAYSEGVQYLLVADDGRGFVVKSDDMIAQTKNGKHVMKPGQGSKCAICRRIDDREDHLAIIGTNRKMLVFTLEEVPEMARGKGVILQKYRDARVSDARPFDAEAGLSFKYGSGESVVDDLTPWLAKRGSVGKMPPNGFPKSNRFDG